MGKHNSVAERMVRTLKNLLLSASQDIIKIESI